MKEKLAAAPKDLSKEMKTWWEGIVAEFVLESSHLKLLALACRAWDRGEAARHVLRKHGLTFTDRHGIHRQRPEVSVERDCSILFARMLRELRIGDAQPDVDDGRIPRNQSSPRRER